MKYILMMNGKKSDFERYARWSKKDLEANVAFMRAFSKELKDAGVFVASEGLGWPNEARLVRAGSKGSRSPMECFRNRRSSLPDTGSSTWKAPSRPSRLPRGFRRRPGGKEDGWHACRSAASDEQSQ